LREELGDEQFAAARELSRCIGGGDLELRGAVLALASACLSAAQSGSTRIPIGTAAGGPLAGVLADLHVSGPVAARAFALLGDPSARGEAAPLFGARGDFRPLLIDRGALSTERMVTQEEDLGRRLVQRLEGELLPYDGAKVAGALQNVLDHPPVLGGGRMLLSDEQQRAILAAAHQPLTVISGGPGTGKTSIVVSLLRLLLRLGWPLDAVALAAPTGKAANRMQESMGNYLAAIPSRPALDEDLRVRGPAPSTLHRLLGYSPTKDRFNHHVENPLPRRIVIVDEASMIDLAMMDQLLRAIRPDARLVLLGDAEQLPSVEAGAVLRDLVPADPMPLARPWDALVGGASVRTGRVADLRAGGAVRLTKSYRLNTADPSGRNIYLVSQVLRSGEVPEVVTTPREEAHLLARTLAADLTFTSVELLASSDGEWEAFYRRWFAERVAGSSGIKEEATRTWPMQGQEFVGQVLQDLSALDQQLLSARILCLTKGRSRPSGAGSVNAILAALLGEHTGEEVGGRRQLLAGTPVLMTRNDYQLGLFNGDQGLVLWVRRAGEVGRQLRAVFRVRGTYQVFELGALGEQVEPCWAMTVHKAQGSEFEHVALVLPRSDEKEGGGEARKLACREVVYTAMTRAKRSVTVLGSEEALREAVGRSIERWSALGADDYWER
jgi:exodeoxyribonuclease V alpha subunit